MRQGLRKPVNICPFQVGTCIRITGNSSNHHYRIGAIYRVHQDGNFGLFSAIDEKATSANSPNGRTANAPASAGNGCTPSSIPAR